MARRSGSRFPVLVLFGTALTALWSLLGQRSFISQPTKAGLAAMRRVYALKLAAAREGARAGCRGNRACMEAVGLFYTTSTGNTMTVAEMIAEATGLEPLDMSDAEPADIAGYDGLIVGTPTWNTDADEQRSGTAWDDHLEELKELDLSGKPVAVFGCGDSQAYGDNFCEALEELHRTFKAAGAKMLGYVDASNYAHTTSKSEVDGKFVGLPIDQDNEDDKTEGRVSAWLDQLKDEGMPL